MGFLEVLWLLPQSRNREVRLIGDSKLSIGVIVSEWLFVDFNRFKISFLVNSLPVCMDVNLTSDDDSEETHTHTDLYLQLGYLLPELGHGGHAVCFPQSHGHHLLFALQSPGETHTSFPTAVCEFRSLHITYVYTLVVKLASF